MDERPGPSQEECRATTAGDPRDLRLSRLEEELWIAREQIHITREELDSSHREFQSASEALRLINEKFQSANEELQCANEELRCANEELENSREELTVLNRELYTVNGVLREKVAELNLAYADRENLYASSGIATIFLDRSLRIRGFTPAVAAIFNLERSDLGRPFRRLSNRIDWQSFSRDAKTVLAGKPFAEREVSTLDGEHCFLKRLSPYHSPQGSIDGVVVSFIDISERKRTELEREDSVEFLRLANESQGTADLIRCAVTFFKKRSGCEAVGIRLHDGGDYPYYETAGFPPEFIRAENLLCSRDQEGSVRRDAAGDPLLDCMCGNVICGRFDTSQPFFSPRGSFWTNSTTHLLASSSEADRQARTRNRCHGEGYQSVALIPLRLGEERLGLLQLNDRRTGRFTPEAIALWEGLADYLAVALAKYRADEALQRSEEQFRTLADAIPQLCWTANADGWISWYNRRWYQYTGTTPEQMRGWGWQSVHDPETLPAVMERWQASIASGEPFDMVFPLRGSDGVLRPFLTRVLPVCDPQGTVVRWFGTNTDISALKKAEKDLHQAHAELELRVVERTDELAATVATLRGEIDERQRMEESLLRLHRLYAVLSETDKTIVRVADRDSLLRDFCRIAVEQGGFLLSWVGMLDPESGRVQQVAACGATGYLEEIQVSALEVPQGFGPTGISIREGGCCICNDFQNDPCTRPWHDPGRAWGIQASASVAVREGGRVIGSLTLYARERDFFDAQHVELVEQMGADVSFALDTLALQARRQQAEQALHEETLARLDAVQELRDKDQMLLQQSRLAAMGEMINNIAHQWRQPLNILGLVLQQLRLYYEMGSFSGEFLDSSVDRGMGLINHMSQTIDDFRGFFRSEKEKVEFTVHEVVARTITLVEDGFKFQHIVIELQASASPSILGFPNEYSQVLLNILMNARDALQERSPEDARVTVSIGKEGERAVVTIADNAGGIPEENLGRVFEPYFTTKGPDKGTGVGLFMSKIIIETNMGGRLTVRNGDQGAEFRIEV